MEALRKSDKIHKVDVFKLKTMINNFFDRISLSENT